MPYTTIKCLTLHKFIEQVKNKTSKTGNIITQEK